MPFVCGRNSWLNAALPKNPLLKTRRRRGDANVVWDLIPLDRTAVGAALRTAATFFPPKPQADDV